MRTKHSVIRRPGVVAASIAVGLALTLAGCGGGGDKKPGGDGPATRPNVSNGTGTEPGKAPASSSPTQVIAQMKGEGGVTVTISRAVRDASGFVTVEGRLTNEGTETFNAISWVGPEVDVQKSGASVAGAVLVDSVGKKRYYVLRDTEGKCLCTMGLTLIKPGETRPLFAQFPAPPEGTTEVEFQLPTMPPAKITIAEG
ncbi:hypothetical protein PV392_27110 [Streptomyces sp. ME03-5709C]|nr:hypothetical protein [Streptomyces sp. ME03-5709C]